MKDDLYGEVELNCHEVQKEVSEGRDADCRFICILMYAFNFSEQHLEVEFIAVLSALKHSAATEAYA